MDVHTRTTDATTFMKLTVNSVSEELARKAVSYVQTNIDEIGKYQASQGQSDNYKHIVVYAETDSGKIVGFRYFFFMPSHSFCHLFATFVDVGYRQRGIGTGLIEESFAIAVSQGCSEFEIRLTQPSPEKDALFEWYRRYARENSHRLKFIIYYWDRMEQYGYS